MASRVPTCSRAYGDWASTRGLHHAAAEGGLTVDFLRRENAVGSHNYEPIPVVWARAKGEDDEVTRRSCIGGQHNNTILSPTHHGKDLIDSDVARITY